MSSTIKPPINDEAENQIKQLLRENTNNKNPKIQRVASHLRKSEYFANHFQPQFVSFGPIHHGAQNLKQGEKYKLLWLAMYLRRTNQSAKALQDVLLLENQLPAEVLVKLMNVQNADKKLSYMIDNFLCIHPLWATPCLAPYKEEGKDTGRIGANSSTIDQPLQHAVAIIVPPPAHVLDYLHRHILVDIYNKSPPIHHSRLSSSSNMVDIRHRNIQELISAGIELDKTEYLAIVPEEIKLIPTKSLRLSGATAKLMLPEITVDATTAITFHNLIAYEKCPDFANDYRTSSFVSFLGSLIDHPEDVKQLTSAGILRNALGSDEQVFELFNKISKDLVIEVGSYSKVRGQIEKHYKSKWIKWKTWRAQAYAKYFSNPWSLIALVGVILGLGLSLAQTVMAFI
ncbi:hypothetical protein PIB30_065309 [Stylosanthes scabra]|uniref:Uncharacterized protein n=1 Tax=Stylosanthes scabra TaxID=79078 RepID=A0ABU6VQB0_9FABA|nr:hypothetical protein [Stylosanthes scabra]